jgi:hypothetical protein
MGTELKNIITLTRVVSILKHNTYYNILKSLVRKLLFDMEKHSIIGTVVMQVKLHKICLILSASVWQES